MKCDFHLHSTKSDGKLTPVEIVLRARVRGLDCISLTDHDTVSGVKDAIVTGTKVNIKVLSGIEISTYKNTEIHILAYNFDYESNELIEELKQVNDMRLSRNQAIVKKLSDLGIDVDLEEIYKNSRGKTVGRPDIADVMVHSGVCLDRTAAFDEYLGVGKVAYVEAKRLTPLQAIELAHRYNGVAVLAHPKNLKMPQHAFVELIKELKNNGLDGIEADYFSHNNTERMFYRSLADRYKLIVTGGSDFHDATHGGEEMFVPNKFTRKVLALEE